MNVSKDWSYRVKEILNYKLFNTNTIVLEFIDKIVYMISNSSESSSELIRDARMNAIDRTITVISKRGYESVVSNSIMGALYKLCCGYKTLLEVSIMEAYGRDYVTMFDEILFSHDINTLASLVYINSIPCVLDGVECTQFTIRLY